MKKICRIIWSEYRNFKKHIIYFLQNTLVLSIICVKCKKEHKIFFKEEKSIQILNILSLTENV